MAQGVYAALLRGINVGGRNPLPMKGLLALFAEAGCTGVQAYLQSGNVVFHADPPLARRVPAVIAEAIAERLGLRVPVITRSAAELGEVVRRNPFLGVGAQETALHVAFLADRPPASKVAALDPRRSPPDAFAVVGREVYLRLPNGVARSKLTNAYFDATLGTTSTLRNWRTVVHLAMLAGAGAGT